MATKGHSAAGRRLQFLPVSRTGALGAVLAAIAVGVFVLAIVTNGPGSGRNPFAFAWALAVLSGGIEVYAIARRGERSLVGYAALAPAAFFFVLLGMEATGLME